MAKVFRTCVVVFDDERDFRRLRSLAPPTARCPSLYLFPDFAKPAFAIKKALDAEPTIERIGPRVDADLVGQRRAAVAMRSTGVFR
jgi:hypothetical protein